MRLYNLQNNWIDLDDISAVTAIDVGGYTMSTTAEWFEVILKSGQKIRIEKPYKKPSELVEIKRRLIAALNSPPQPPPPTEPEPCR
jgi:hypothetical protein